RVAAVSGLLVLCGLLAYHVVAAAPPKDAKGDSQALRCAQARLRLAELTLQKVNEINRKVPLTLSEAVTPHMNDKGKLAKTHLQTVMDTGSADPFRDALAFCEVALRNAESKLKKAQRANQVSPGTIDTIDIDRMRLGVEIATLQLEHGKSLASASAEA